MSKQKLFNLTITLLILLVTFACGKEENNNNINSNSNNNDNSPATPSPTPLSLATETPLPKKTNTPQPTISPPQKSDQDILKIIYSKENEIKLCDGQLDPEVSRQSSSVYALNKQEYLVEILCFMGAYQGNYEYILYKNEGGNLTIKPLLFKSFIADGQGKFNSTTVRSLAGISNYNSEQKVLNVYTKDRGLGDCGSTAQYQWGNNDFELIEYKSKSECDGNALEPEDYPVIYTNKKQNSPQSQTELSAQDLINNILNQKDQLNFCTDGFQEDVAQEYSQVYDINNQEKLVQIICYSGAYQPGSHFFLVNNNDIQPLYFTQFIENENREILEEQENFITGLADYDQNQQTLSIFSKYAGHGGCGTSAKYQWQEISFELLEYKANFDCNNAISPEDWQLIYPK